MTFSGLPASISGLLPALQLSTGIVLGSSDVLIHAPGFEDRTMGVSDSVIYQRGARAVLLDYRPFDPKNRLSNVIASLTSNGFRIDDEDIIAYHRFVPDDFESRLRKGLLDNGAMRVVTDISSMSKLAIMLVMNVCKKLRVQVVVVYTEANNYSPSQAAFEHARENDKIHQPTLQVFTGVHGVVRIDSLASVWQCRGSQRLPLFSCHSMMRSRKCCSMRCILDACFS